MAERRIASPVQVQRFLSGVDYPVRKRDLIDTARGHGADREVMETLERLPDRTYNSPTDVTEEIGKLV